MAKQYAIMCKVRAQLVSKVCVYYRYKLSARQLFVQSVRSDQLLYTLHCHYKPCQKLLCRRSDV